MTARRWWNPVLAGLLVAGALGVGGGGAVAAEPRLTARTITVPAAAFNPVNNVTDFGSNGDELWTFSGGGQFTAPLFFEAPEVTIRKMTLFVWDNNSSGDDICVGLFRTTPASADEQNMGFVCSSGASTIDPAVFTQRTFTARRVTGAYGPYLFLWLPGSLSQGYRFYGVRITYAY